jgi:hypothetical protein
MPNILEAFSRSFETVPNRDGLTCRRSKTTRGKGETSPPRLSATPRRNAATSKNSGAKCRHVDTTSENRRILPARNGAPSPKSEPWPVSSETTCEPKQADDSRRRNVGESKQGVACAIFGDAS